MIASSGGLFGRFFDDDGTKDEALECDGATCGGAADADEDEADAEELMKNGGTVGSDRVETLDGCKLDEDVNVSSSDGFDLGSFGKLSVS